ncbi:MAG TPA: hypothetical protein VK477_03580, partial [Acidobacteriota bacterium]|nr:hypothetical protein [Acidobacteriota bacterium]
MKPIARFALLLSAVTATAFAADQTSSSSSSSSGGEVREAPRNYTDNTTTYRVDSTYNNFGYNYGFNSGFGHFPGPFNSGYSTTVTVRRQIIFLPPTPPALGEAIPVTRQRSTTLTAMTLPPILRNCIYDTFYAPLSALMYSEDLSRKRRETLDGYIAARLQAANALRAKLEALATADPDTRQRELIAFAAEQTPQLAALETTADGIRDNLVNGSWLQSGVDWEDLRQWRLGDDTRWESQLDEIKVIVGASFFEDGLSSAQRLLLREMAMELADSLAAPDADISLGTPGPYFYFSPFTARIRLPAGLPAELEAKIDAYRTKKAALKHQLRDALYKTDRAFFASTRINAVKALATTQAPEFAAIEQLAEEIRIGLAPFPNPARPAALPLPAPLIKRISAYMAQKNAWQKTMMEKLNALRTQFPDDRVEFSRLDGAPSIQIVANRRAKADTAAKRNAANVELAAFNAGQRKGYDALARDKEQLTTEITQIASSLAGRQSAKTIDQQLAVFDHALRQQETWLRYSDYELAVLQPGLSPEQRRLLFSAALEKLDLPLLNR